MTLTAPPMTMRPSLSQPRPYLVRMGLFVVAVAIVAGVLADGLETAFLANTGLNSVILFALLFGIFFSFRTVVQLEPDVAWADGYAAQRRAAPMAALPQPRLLSPIARLLVENQGVISLSALSMRSLLDGIGARLTESREISRYLIGLLIFLGLLGTFWGLLETVRSAGGVIGSLSMDGTDLGTVFASLKEGLEAPLRGMGTAFSSSLFGLAGSLVLGFLELQATQAQNRFYNELEDWLSANIRLSDGGTADGGGFEVGETPIPSYVTSVVAQTAENLDALRRLTLQSEELRLQHNAALATVAEQLTALVDHLRTQQGTMRTLADGQAELRPVLARLSETLGREGFAIDEGTRQHIRNLDAHTRRLLEETATGRLQLSGEIRGEIKLLARTIAALADDPSAQR